MEQLKGLFSDAQAAFQRLSTRERRLVVLAGSAAVAFILFLILFSFSNSAAGYRRRIEEKQLKLREAQALAESYTEAERTRQDVERQLSSGAVQLSTFLEEKGTAAGLEIPIMTPKGDVALGDGKIVESSVELNFTDVNIRKLHDFLTNVERGPGVVKVKFMRLEPRPTNETITAWVNIATYRLKQQ
jgi:general secretion pathway protein M